jgi:hypothetical protein
MELAVLLANWLTPMKIGPSFQTLQFVGECRIESLKEIIVHQHAVATVKH